MTTTAIPEQVTTNITIKGRTEITEQDGSLGYKLECEAPLLYGPRKLPIIIWGCPAKGAPKLGETLAAVLTRGKPSDKYNGSKYWHYQWRWSTRAAAGSPVAEAAPEPSGGPDEREQRISRSVALAQAVGYVAIYPRIGDGENSVAQVIDIAAEFYAWLMDGPKQGPETPPAVRTATPRSKPTSVPATIPTSVGELLTRATKELGYKSRQAVFSTLEIQSAQELAEPEARASAWQKLVETASKQVG